MNSDSVQRIRKIGKKLEKEYSTVFQMIQELQLVSKQVERESSNDYQSAQLIDAEGIDSVELLNDLDANLGELFAICDESLEMIDQIIEKNARNSRRNKGEEDCQYSYVNPKTPNFVKEMMKRGSMVGYVPEYPNSFPHYTYKITAHEGETLDELLEETEKLLGWARFYNCKPAKLVAFPMHNEPAVLVSISDPCARWMEECLRANGRM